MGGAVVVDVAYQRLFRRLCGVLVIDVVEGSAMEALANMNAYIATRPRQFGRIEEAVQWSVRSHTVRHLPSARVSIPPLLCYQNDRYEWRTDLSKTEDYWTGWFEDMSRKFIKCPASKLLLLAGVDRLDKELMIGQMQGKFQLEVFPEAGHFVQEDQPLKTATLIYDFWRRNLPLGLSKIIAEHAPSAIKNYELKSYFGRKIAIDASMCIYQFMVAVRQQDGQLLTDTHGETTSHLMGMFYRTVRLVENGIKPVYVFDGKPPTMKSGELAKRKARKEEAMVQMEEAIETGNTEDALRFGKRVVKVTKEHNEECKRLLKAMGIPYIEAPTEAEAQCAELAKSGKVFGAASEDMDTVTFGSPVLLRHLTFSEQRKMLIEEIHVADVLKETGLTMSQEHGSIEKVLENLSGKAKEGVPENWMYPEARELFTSPEVLSGKEIEVWMSRADSVSREDRIRKSCEKLEKNVKGATQSRMMDYFTTTPVDTQNKKRVATPLKGSKTKKRPAAK
ncbi:PIN domain-like protein [Spinellus fusiger]|nr:PIN domain-like protein [Spinellus fusiger]